LADALESLGRSVVYGIASRSSTDEARDDNELFLGDFEAIVSTTLGIFSALELEILLVCLSRDTWLVIAHFRRGCSQFNRRRSWVGFHQHYFVKRVSFQQMIVHYATNVLLILSSTLMRCTTRMYQRVHLSEFMCPKRVHLYLDEMAATASCR